ncbi:MAG: hypothetical protein JXR71_10050 [Bacteroidales bacterium]|nr:hypothetical protein [Bacteroidales bacterium]
MNTNNKQKLSLEQLLRNLKDEDANHATVIKRFQYIYVVFFIFYAIITTLVYVFERDLRMLLSGVSFMSSFIILAVLFRKYYKEYRFVDYSLPTLLLLKRAASRYQLFQTKALWLLVAFGFMDVALTLNMQPRVSPWIVQIIILATLLVALVIGIIRWWYKYKPLLDNTRRLISEIETD